MGTRITKTEASQVAKLMVNATIEKKRQFLKEQISALMTPVVEKTIPKEIKDAFKVNPNYFRTNTKVNAVLNGRGSERVELLIDVPTIEGWGACYETPKEIYNEIVKLSNERSKLKEQSNALKSNIESILISLVTFKKIKEQFPEAYNYIPVEWLSESFTTPALPIEGLTKELQKYK